MRLIVQEQSVTETLKQRQLASGGGDSPLKSASMAGGVLACVLLLSVLAYTLGSSNDTTNSVAMADTEATPEPELIEDAPPESDAFEMAPEDSDADEPTEFIPPNRPADNIPDGLRKFEVFSVSAGRGADCFVTSDSDADVGKLPVLTISSPPDNPRRKVFIRFDISKVQKHRSIRTVHLLLTLRKNRLADLDKLRFSVLTLREDSPMADWAESGPNRIVHAHNPVQVPGTDSDYIGVLNMDDCWYQTASDSFLMFQYTDGPLVSAVRRDKDGCLLW